MLLRTTLFADQLTHLSDARYFAASGAEFLCFCFDEASPHCISTAQAKELTAWISGTQIVADGGNLSEDALNDICFEIGISAVVSNKNLHRDLLLPQIQTIFRRISVHSVPEAIHQISALGTQPDIYHEMLILDFGHINLSAEELEALQALRFAGEKLFLKMNFTTDSLQKTLHTLPFLKGLLLSGDDEISLGLRNFSQVADLVEMLEG